MPPVPPVLTVEYIPWAEPLFQGLPWLQDCELVLLDRPGLGLEIDEAGMRRYPYE